MPLMLLGGRDVTVQ